MVKGSIFSPSSSAATIWRLLRGVKIFKQEQFSSQDLGKVKPPRVAVKFPFVYGKIKTKELKLQIKALFHDHENHRILNLEVYSI